MVTMLTVEQTIERILGQFPKAKMDRHRKVFEAMTGEERETALNAVMDAWGGNRVPPPAKFRDALAVKHSAAVRNEHGEWPWEERERLLSAKAREITALQMMQHGNPPADERGMIEDKARMMAMIELDWPPGHPNHFPRGKPDNPLRYVNERLTGIAHDEWLSAAELEACQSRRRTREGLDRDQIPKQGPKPLSAPEIDAQGMSGGEYLEGGELPPVEAYEG